MESKQEKRNVLTPDISGSEYYRPQRKVDFSKHIVWLKKFHQIQPPAGATIEIRKEETK
jgi:hypothetical protein